MTTLNSYQRLFITGGAGFIGSHLVERLVKNGFQLTIYDNLRRNSIKYTSLLQHPNVKFIKGDIMDMALLKESMANHDIIIHAAAIAGVSNYSKFSALTFKTNLIGTYHVLESMLAHGIKRILDFSTTEVFGPSAQNFNEESLMQIGPPHDKRWCYAASKIAGEQLSTRYAEEYGLEAIIIRPCNVYGPRQVGEGAISNFCRNLTQNKKMIVEGDGTAIRTWCYINDFVDIFIRIMNDDSIKVGAFNIGNPWTIICTYALAQTVLRQAKGIVSQEQGPDYIEFKPMEWSEIKVRCLSIQKLKSRFNWMPKVGLEEGILQTYLWFKDHYAEN
jgi:nucleoside-diphosphate-sugar epimerase